MQRSHWVLLVFLITAANISCKKSDVIPAPGTVAVSDSAAEITSYSIPGMNPQVSITSSIINIKFPQTVVSGKDLVASFTLSPGAHAYLNNIVQVSGETKNNFESTLFYTVKGPAGSVKHWTVISTNNDYSQKWGLGHFAKKSFNNDPSYNWYFSQSGSGALAYINCGPTCAAMAMKWADSTSTGLPVDARNYYPQNVSLWGQSTISEYLRDYQINTTTLPLGETEEQTRDILKTQLDNGHIVVLVLSTSDIRYNAGVNPDLRVDKYYTDNFSHIIIVNGYKEVDDEFYFQVNDPWCYGL